MLPNKYCIKKAWLLFPLLLLSVLLHAQDEVTDTTVSVQIEPIDDSDAVPKSTSSIYFEPKAMQPNGGGPNAIQSKKVPDTLIRKLKADGDFWYVDYNFNKKQKEKEKQADQDFKKSKNYQSEENSGSFLDAPFFQTLLWILIIGGFAAVVIMYLSNSNTALFRKKNRMIQSDEEMEAVTDNIFEINYQREIDKAVINGNYRFAVRLMFLRVLKNMSDTKVIQYAPDRTNFDYLLQLQGKSQYADFFKLTRNYEYSWYGHFDIDTDKFSWIRKDFESFDQKLKS